ncbi:MAG TPA: glycolate oxidase subunit GlcE [Xanthobacteraceae bacterium]|jgi:glycolate oxidase FAD binding subunit
MADVLTPHSAKDIEASVQWALAHGKTIEILGHGSKRAIGRPLKTDLVLDMSGLSGVTLYEPQELVLSAKAGTSIAEIDALLASEGQQLAFEPMDVGPLFGASAGRGTLGGTVAANLSGPRRIKIGAARDHVLGFSAVSGMGEAFKSGGRVVKNVTGYDLSKLMAGSWGTLAALTDLTIKVLPRPETESTVLLFGCDESSAVHAMVAATRSSCDVSGAAHLPAAAAAAIGIDEVASASRAITAFRIEGVAPSVAHRKAALQSLSGSFGEIGVLDEALSSELWRNIRDAIPFAAARTGAERPLWRVSTAPARGAEAAALVGQTSGAEVMFDWAGGLLWVLLPSCEDSGAALVRRAVAAVGGHATLIRAPADARAAIDVFEPQDPPLAALTRRVKEGFDPNRTFNPRRMWAGQ